MNDSENWFQEIVRILLSLDLITLLIGVNEIQQIFCQEKCTNVISISVLSVSAMVEISNLWVRFCFLAIRAPLYKKILMI